MTVEPEAMVTADNVIDELAKEIVPGVTVTVGSVLVITLPPIVALIDVAVPAIAPVNVDVYAPSPTSLVDERVPVLVPPLRENTTVCPPFVRALPEASRVRSVAVNEEPEATVVAESVIED